MGLLNTIQSNPEVTAIVAPIVAERLAALVARVTANAKYPVGKRIHARALAFTLKIPKK